MVNHWWATRPKRRLNSVPEVLAVISSISLDMEWEGQRSRQRSLEDQLEAAGIKRVGERRDASGSGARTYAAWLKSLGLIFKQQSTGSLKLTLAGEAVMKGDHTVEVIKNQVMKYQFPSSFSIGRGVDVSGRFRIRPFIFLIKLLVDPRIGYFTQEELAKIIMVEAENETDTCYEKVVSRILAFRSSGDQILEDNFLDKYVVKYNPEHPYSKLEDTANTFINWLEYTQLIVREEGKVLLLPDKIEEAKNILQNVGPLIDRPTEEEYFQRKYGLDPYHTKDTRNLSATKSITAKIIQDNQIQKAFISISIREPVIQINASIIDQISEATGYDPHTVENTLMKLYPKGAVGAFLPEYFDMAFSGTKRATEFEKATVSIFQDVFGYKASHVGPIGLTPDVLLLSGSDGYQAIIDNKAYSKYTINNDHYNRMVYNYINNLSKYSKHGVPLAFFSYIAGGFGSNFNSQVNRIHTTTGVGGSGINVSTFIKMIQEHQSKPYTHADLREIFSVNREVSLSDITKR